MKNTKSTSPGSNKFYIHLLQYVSDRITGILLLTHVYIYIYFNNI